MVYNACELPSYVFFVEVDLLDWPSTSCATRINRRIALWISAHAHYADSHLCFGAADEKRTCLVARSHRSRAIVMIAAPLDPYLLMPDWLGSWCFIYNLRSSGTGSPLEVRFFSWSRKIAVSKHLRLRELVLCVRWIPGEMNQNSLRYAGFFLLFVIYILLSLTI